MCPKFIDGICEVAGIEPEYVECVDKNYCFSSRWERCNLYIAEILISCNETLQRDLVEMRLHRNEIAEVIH